MQTSRSLLLGLWAVSLGCSCDGGSSVPKNLVESIFNQWTKGRHGQLEFSYTGRLNCILFGCSLAQPTIPGASESIRTRSTSPVLPQLKAVSSSASVATFEATRHESCCPKEGGTCTNDPPELCKMSGMVWSVNYSIAVQTLTAGQTDLVLETPEGQEFERVTLTVAPVARVEVSWGNEETGSRIELQKGKDVVVSASVYLADDAVPFVTKGIHFQVASMKVAVLREYGWNWSPPEVQSLVGSQVRLVAVGAGDTKLGVRAGDIESSPDVHVTP